MKKLAVSLTAFLSILLLLATPGTVLAERTGSDKTSDFATYLKDANLPALYLAELKSLCLEEGDLSACRECGNLLGEEGRFDEATSFADRLTYRRRDVDLTARLIKSYSLFGAGHYLRGVSVLDSLIEMLPPKDTMVEAVLLRAKCQLSFGLADEALLNLRSIEPRVKSGQRLAYLVWRGKAEEARGDLAKATRLYEEAWKGGAVEAAIGLVRCDLRDDKIDACLALQREVSKRGLALPPKDACDLAGSFGEVLPVLWHALVRPVIEDTAFDVRACPEIIASMVRLAEAEEDVSPYCAALLGRDMPAVSKQSLKYARALSYKEPRIAADSLTVLAREVSDPLLEMRCLGRAMALAPDRREALLKDLGSGIRPLLGRLMPDERLSLSRTLIDCGLKEMALTDIEPMLEGLKVGHDDEAIAEIASLIEKAGDTKGALVLYESVAQSPLLSETGLRCERQAFLLRNLVHPELDIAKEVEKIAKKGASDLELGDLFMEKLKDYERAAAYYRAVVGSPPKGADVDRIRFKLAQALALGSLTANSDAAKAEALDLVASLIASKSVKPDEVVAAVKLSTDWLQTDRPRVAQIATGLSERKDLSSSSLYGVTGLLYYLFLQGDLAVYDRCAALLSRIVTESSSSKQAPPAALALARLKFLAGDYVGAREAYAMCAEKWRDPAIASLSNVGIGECYLHSGGISKGVNHLKKGSDSPETCYKIARCYEIIGQPDSSITYYRASLLRLASSALMDRVRLRLALRLLEKEGIEAALGVLDSPLPEVRKRLDDPRHIVIGSALFASGYYRIGTDILEKTASGSSPFACESALIASRVVSRDDPALAQQMLMTARPAPDDVFEEYALLLDRARYGCSSSEPGLCTEPKQQFRKRFPLDQDSFTELNLRRALVILEEAPSDTPEPMVDSLITSGVKHPLMAEVLYRKGIGLLVQGDYPGAEKVFRRIGDTYPDSELDRDACFKLGSTYYLMEKYDSSALYFGLAALSSKPSLARDALFNYSLALEQIREFAKAAQASNQLSVRFPFADQFERSLVRTGFCLQSDGKPFEALAAYSGVLRYTEQAETMAETRYWMGESFSEMGDHLRAACEFLRIGYLYPKEGQWAGTASYMAGAECEKAGLTDHAAAIYRQNVRKFGKTSDWGKASDERLTELLKAKETSKRIQPLGEKEPPKDKEAPGAK